jgi:hypothetical protein
MDHPGNPLYEGTATAAKGAAESVAALVMLMEYLRRSRELADAAESHRRLEDATRQELEQRRAESNAERWRTRDSSQWRLCLEKGWMRTATVDEVIHVWTHSLPWLREDVRAQQAKRMAEERLDRLDPNLMQHYRQQVEKGLDPLTAMTAARRPVPATTRPPRSGSAQQMTVPALGPVPDAWETGPVVAGALPRAQVLELAAAGPVPMGPTGWTDADRARRGAPADRDRVTAKARAALEEAAAPDGRPATRRKRRIAAYADAVTSEKRRPLLSRAGVVAEESADLTADGVARARSQQR